MNKTLQDNNYREFSERIKNAEVRIIRHYETMNNTLQDDNAKASKTMNKIFLLSIIALMLGVAAIAWLAFFSFLLLLG